MVGYCCFEGGAALFLKGPAVLDGVAAQVVFAAAAAVVGRQEITVSVAELAADMMAPIRIQAQPRCCVVQLCKKYVVFGGAEIVGAVFCCIL